MNTIGFIKPAYILDEIVPDSFIEPQGTFREYLHAYHVKNDKVLFLLCRGKQQYQPSEVEIELWRSYFGVDSEVNFYEHLTEFNPTQNEATDII